MKKTLKKVIIDYVTAFQKMNEVTLKYTALYDNDRVAFDTPQDEKLAKDYSDLVGKYDKYLEKLRNIIYKNTTFNSLSLAKSFANILTKNKNEKFVVETERYDNEFYIYAQNLYGDKKYCIDAGVGKEKKAERNLFDTEKNMNDKSVKLISLVPAELNEAFTDEKSTTPKSIQKDVNELFEEYVEDKVKDKLPELEM